MKTHKNNLLLIAGIVWGIAGFNILRIGILAYTDCWSSILQNVISMLISVAVYIIFQLMVFGKMVKKHTIRITSYAEDYQLFFKFFDLKSFCIMAFMITVGITLRVSGVCLDIFIAVFYTGLGASLFTAGILFLVNFIRVLLRKDTEPEEDPEPLQVTSDN